jgi:hypothetical protein
MGPESSSPVSQGVPSRFSNFSISKCHQGLGPPLLMLKEMKQLLAVSNL